MEKATKRDVMRFAVLGLIGIFLYFIPVSGSSVPVVLIVNFIKGILGDNLKYVVLFALALLVAIIIGARFFKNEACAKYLGNVSTYKQIHYCVALLVVLAVWFNLPPAAIFADPNIGGQVLTLAGPVYVHRIHLRLVHRIRAQVRYRRVLGTLLEPLMRPLFKMPGAAAVNCLSSYVVSAAVGVYMTDQYYESKVYTQREATAAAVCFSTISVGYIGVLSSIGGIENMYGTLLLLTFVMVFVMTVITVRIPPLSRVPNTYIDGTTEPADAAASQEGSRFQRAVNAAALRSRDFTMAEFWKSLVSALKFAQTIIAYMIPIVIVTLSLVHLTPLFTWLGKPIAPVLSLLGLPDAAAVAPAVLLGFIEVSLPAISVSTGVAAQSVFFVVMLSISQIIFMTEAGNAMLGSKMKISFGALVVNFVVRTVICIPIIALLSHLLF